MKKAILSLLCCVSLLGMLLVPMCVFPAAAETTTVPNGGFERGTTNWNGQTAAFVAFTAETEEQAHTGVRSGLIAGASRRLFSDLSVSTWKPTVGGQYYLTFWAMGDAFAGDAYIQVMLRDAGGNGDKLYFANSNKTLGNSWVQYTFDVSAILAKITDSTTATRLWIETGPNASGKLYVDDVNFVEETLPKVDFPNGSFESGIWSKYNNTASAVENEFHVGGKAAQLAGNNTVFADLPVTTLTPDVTKKYFLRFFAKNKDFAGRAIAKLQLCGAGGTGGDLKIFDTGISLGDEWVEYRYDVTSVMATATAATTAIRVYVTVSGYASGNLYVDDFSLVEGVCRISGQQIGHEEVAVTNGGFESGIWPKYNDTAAVFSGAFHSGAASGKMTGNNTIFSDLKTVDWTPDPAMHYYLRFWARSQNFVGKAVAKVERRGSGGITGDFVILNTDMTLRDEWTEYTFDLTNFFAGITEATTSIRTYVTVSSYTSGALLLDDFSFVEGTCIEGKHPIERQITAETVTGGAVTADVVSTMAGSTVTTTVTPEAGYQLKAGSLMAYDADDNAIAVPQRVGFRANMSAVTHYAFQMPDEAVTLRAEFINLATATEPNMGLVGRSINPDLQGLRNIYRMYMTENEGKYYVSIGGEQVEAAAFGVLMCTEVTYNKLGSGLTLEAAAENSYVKNTDFALRTMRYDACNDYQDLSIQVTGLNTAARQSTPIWTRAYVKDSSGHVYYTDAASQTYAHYAQ